MDPPALKPCWGRGGESEGGEENCKRFAIPAEANLAAGGGGTEEEGNRGAAAQRRRGAEAHGSVARICGQGCLRRSVPNTTFSRVSGQLL